MKAHSVKSNAKRAARKVAEAAPDKWEAAEPVPAEDGGWYSALQAKVPGLAHDLFVVHPVPVDAELRAAPDTPDDVSGTAGDVIARMGAAEEPAPVEAVGPDADDEVASLRPIGRVVETPPAVPTKPAPADPPPPPKPTAADMAALLPPPTRSTKEEIEARRAERRERVEAEKAAGLRDRQGKKVEPVKTPKRADIILALVSRQGGATVDELMRATNWPRHTLRGYIAGTLRTRGHDLVSTKGLGGAATVYKLEAAS